MKRILICGLTDTYGGMEAFVLEFFRNADKSRIQFDFLIFEHQTISYADEIRSLGGSIIVLPLFRNHPFSFYSELDKVFRNNAYDVVYYHSTHRIKSLRVLSCAKKRGVPVIAVHSHGSRDDEAGLYRKIREAYSFRRFKKVVNKRLACSSNAGKWMFGDEPFEIIPNPINVKRFSYNEEKRKKIRDSLGIGNELVVGTVGRMTYVKNPLFMTEVFEKVLKKKNAYFIHVGDGDMMDMMKTRIKEKKLDGKYLLPGSKDNVPDYLSAMDVFLFTSFYEGFPISLIEAQANGLRCLVSDTIVEDCDITGNVFFRSINDDPEIWAESIINASEYKREDRTDDVIDKGYDAAHVASRLYQVLEI